jgi:hypothetical protein
MRGLQRSLRRGYISFRRVTREGRWLSVALYATSRRCSTTLNVRKEKRSVHYTIKTATKIDKDMPYISGRIHS